MAKIIEPSFEILTPINGEQILKHIELCGRVCYKSENLITEDSAKRFVEKITQRNHQSVLEHFSITVKFITDRGISHEIVRHRLASFSQESSRYCSYNKDKFGNEITVIRPSNLNDEQYKLWKAGIEDAEMVYFQLLNNGSTPEIARSVLPTCTKTELIVTANLREWKHIFEMRCSEAAHPDVRKIMIPLREEFRKLIPVIFDEFSVILKVNA